MLFDFGFLNFWIRKFEWVHPISGVVQTVYTCNIQCIHNTGIQKDQVD